MPLPPLHFDGPGGAGRTFAFAHGAGIGMNSDFMDYFAGSLGARGVRVARFEFPYMQKMRADGTRRPPDRADVLLDTWMEVVNHFGPGNLYIGGKSMGGRVASHAADQAESSGDPVAGVICLGFPFHSPRQAGSRPLPERRHPPHPHAHFAGHPRSLRQPSRRCRTTPCRTPARWCGWRTGTTPSSRAGSRAAPRRRTGPGPST